jgi:ribosomal protein S18 acetylase RimI-like enzyme
MNTRPLTSSDFASLLACFNESFSDYLVPFVLDEARLTEIVARRGVDLTASIGAFDGDRMVAFTLNGVDGERAYDSGTGVVPSHRRTGLGRAVMDASFELLRERGKAAYVLEVLETNEKAAMLYCSLGFEETRRFQCWTFEAKERAHARELANVDLNQIKSWADAAPSWQNDTPSIRRAKEPYVALGDEQASIIVFPKSGDLPLLAVSKEGRRAGHGKNLLNAAATRAAKPLRILNVDDRDPGIAAFLERVGAQRTVRQIEVIRSLR